MSTTKNVDALRAILFDTIDGVKRGDISIDKAKLIAELTQVMVNSSKVEVDFLRATNGKGRATGFLGTQPDTFENGAPGALPAPASDQE